MSVRAPEEDALLGHPRCFRDFSFDSLLCFARSLLAPILQFDATAAQDINGQFRAEPAHFGESQCRAKFFGFYLALWHIIDGELKWGNLRRARS